MPDWLPTFYWPCDSRGQDDLDELDVRADPCDEDDEVPYAHGYSSRTLPEELDRILEEVDPECWEHVARLDDLPA